MRPEGYLLDNAGATADGRFDALSALYDPVTARHLDELGVGAGWRCWEVGTPGAAALELANVAQLRAGLVAGGHATDAEIDAHLADVDAVRVDLTNPPLISARGRRPRERQ